MIWNTQKRKNPFLNVLHITIGSCLVVFDHSATTQSPGPAAYTAMDTMGRSPAASMKSRPKDQKRGVVVKYFVKSEEPVKGGFLSWVQPFFLNSVPTSFLSFTLLVDITPSPLDYEPVKERTLKSAPSYSLGGRYAAKKGVFIVIWYRLLVHIVQESFIQHFRHGVGDSGPSPNDYNVQSTIGMGPHFSLSGASALYCYLGQIWLILFRCSSVGPLNDIFDEFIANTQLW